MNAFGKRISSHSTGTTTHCDVVVNITFRISSTHINTWIDTFVPNTSLRWWTISAEYALGATAEVWVAMILRKAVAFSVVCTNGIRTTRRGLAWVDVLNDFYK